VSNSRLFNRHCAAPPGNARTLEALVEEGPCSVLMPLPTKNYPASTTDCRNFGRTHQLKSPASRPCPESRPKQALVLPCYRHRHTHLPCNQLANHCGQDDRATPAQQIRQWRVPATNRFPTTTISGRCRWPCAIALHQLAFRASNVCSWPVTLAPTGNPNRSSRASKSDPHKGPQIPKI